jgi:hypothetical protein
MRTHEVDLRRLPAVSQSHPDPAGAPRGGRVAGRWPTSVPRCPGAPGEGEPAGAVGDDVAMVTGTEVRAFAATLPRAYEALVRDRIKFRVGRIVFLSLSPDETEMGFGYPKEEREALVAGEPEKFRMPLDSDLRYHWVRCWLGQIDEAEMRELVVDAWRMCVPKKVWTEYAEAHPM